jgi:hypothetical protein
MTKIIGKNRTFGIKKETVRGVEETTGINFIPVENFDPNFNVEQIPDESASGTLADACDMITVGKLGAVNISLKGGLTSLGHLLRAVTGQAPNFTAGTPNLHTFEMSNDATQDSFTIVDASAIQDFAYPLGLLEKFSITLSQKSLPQFDVTFKSKAPVKVTVGESISEEEILLHTGFEFRYGNDINALSTNDKICVRDFQFTKEKVTIEDMCVSSSDPNDITNGLVSVMGNFEVAFENTNYHDEFMAETQKAIQIVIAGATANEGLTINLPKVKLTSLAKSSEANEIVTQKIEFKGLLDKTTLKQVTYILANTEPSGTY